MGEEPVRQISGDDPSSDGGEADGTENRRGDGRRENAVRQQRHNVDDGPVHGHANKEHGRCEPPKARGPRERLPDAEPGQQHFARMRRSLRQRFHGFAQE
jgi:hypothetical protein